MRQDELFIIENAAADDDLDVLLATHRCADCAEYAFLWVSVDDGAAEAWLCETCADEREAAVRSERAQRDRAA
ncbi:hypothetical protein [Humibacter albus]|uniref:hypothetical protein n=1 Tax=Humibacter albus TaxID=427754 RepID=UPI0003B55B12|nr:hypothetical protein [Humibacter albus]